MSFIAEAQNGSEEILLPEFLKSVEDRFQITFSFADENIEGIRIKTPGANLTLEQILTFLENQTNLEFERVDENFITIIKPKTGWIICGNIIAIPL